MAHSTQREWFTVQRLASRRRDARRRNGTYPSQRRLRIEPLEDRRLLSITVNTLVDELDGSLVDGDISLRDAIAAAAQGETINFGVTGTINLTNLGHLTLNKNLTINGPGATLLTINAFDPTPTVNNGDGSRLFNIDDGNFAEDKTVAISGLTLTGGDVFGDGGGIRNAENLTVTGSTISGNVAHGSLVIPGYYGNYYYDHVGGGIWSSGSLTVTGTAVSGNTATGSGGGIHSTGNLTVTNSAVSGNTTPRDGAGIFRGISAAAAVVTNSTISSNLADGNGGGIFGNNLTVTGGTISSNSAKLAGGGISGGNLTIAGSTIKSNSAVSGGGGISSFGDLAVTSTTISGNTTTGPGGGILGGNVTVTTSAISGNSATGHGGGLFSSGNVSARASTIADNMAGGSGGGVHVTGTSVVLDSCTLIANRASGVGGGVNSTSANLTVINCTFSANVAVGHGGGIYVNPIGADQATTSIAYSTVVNNRADAEDSANHFGGGVFARTGKLVLDHSIVADNYQTPNFDTRSDVAGLLGVVIDAQWSLVGHNADSGLAEAPVGSPDGKGNRIGGAVGGAIDPLLGPLVANGGPTQTYALLAGSPALDAGRPASVPGVAGVPLHDQRGNLFTRVFDGGGSGGARIDIGAYERQSVVGLSLVVDTLKDESDGDYSLGDLSLREAIELARGSVLTAESITFASSLTSSGSATIMLTLGELEITDALSIIGPGASVMTIDARGNDPTPGMKNGDGSRVFNIGDNDNEMQFDVLLSGLTLTGGDVGDFDGGGAIRNLENLTISSSTISGNAALNGSGGGIHSGYSYYYGDVTLNNSTVSGNSAGGYGGGISAGNLTVNNSTITGNSSLAVGGGIFAENLDVIGSTISANSAGYAGGGIFGINMNVTASKISDNSASYSGGGIYGSDLTVTSSTISGNSAEWRGGGIYNYGGNLMVVSSTISGNSADSGGGIYHYYSDLTLTNSTVSGNEAESAGGGIFNYYGMAEIEFSTITGNKAPAGMGSGVASYGDNSTRTEVRSSIIAGNVNSDVSFLTGSPNSFRSSGYNLIGSGNAIGRFNQTGDQTGVANPLLGPLAENGAPTWTHAPLVGSLAIDRGSPTGVAGSGGVPMFDQRGAPYARVFNGDGAGGARIDIGSLELQPIAAPALPGDYNLSGVVDAADYAAWRKAMGSIVTAYSGADGDGNGVVDQADYGVWRAHFGQALAPPDAGSGTTESSALAEPESLPTIVVIQLPSDAVFTTLGQRVPVKPMAAGTALQSAAIDAAVSDSLLLVSLGRAIPTPADDYAQAADLPSENDASSLELTLELTRNRLAVVRVSTDFARFAGL